jgi:hypothetical protein
MPGVRLSPPGHPGICDLEKAGAAQLLDAIDDALDILEASPGDPRARKRLFTGGLWGIPVRDRADDWLIIWEHDEAGGIRVRYLGADPFA